MCATPPSCYCWQLFIVLFVAWVQADIVDRFNPFILEFNVEIPVPEIVPGDGNEVPFDFRNNPVVSLSGSRELQVRWGL